MTSAVTRFVVVSSILLGSAVQASLAADCSSAKTAYHTSPSLPLAASYIECFEQPVDSSGGGSSGGTWVPRNPLIGEGPQPGQPNYHQLETYLNWLQDAYGISDEDWAMAMQASRVPGSYDVLVNDNVIIVPRNNLPTIRTPEDVDAVQLNRVRPGYLDGLQVEQFQNLDMGGFQ